MYKKVVILVLLLVVLAGCDYLDFNGEEEVEMPSSCPETYQCDTGNEALYFTIIEPDPTLPDDYRYVEEGDKIMPHIFIENNGEDDAEGQICIAGLDDNVFGFSGCDCQDFSVYVQELSGYDFEFTDVYFPYYTANLGEKSGYTETLNFYTRYRYKTYGIIEACLKGDVQASGCDHSGDVLKQSSSSPIKVTEVYQVLKTHRESNSVDIDFTIKVEDNTRDNEMLWDYNEVFSSECSIEKDFDTQAKVNLYMEDLFGFVDCGYVTMIDGEGETRCSVEGIPLEQSGGSILEDGYREIDGYVELVYALASVEGVGFSVRAG